MKVLAIGAHHDDIEMGCGGAVALHSRAGDDVMAIVVTGSGFVGSDGREVRSNKKVAGEAKAASKILGIKKLINLDFPTNNVPFDESLVLALRKIVDEYEPDIVYTHWDGDAHLDHRNVAKATLTACRHVPTLLAYASNWYVGSRPFNPVLYRDITDTFDIKMKALRAYASEFSRRGEVWSRFIECTCGLYGLRCGAKWAEGYEVIKFKNNFG